MKSDLFFLIAILATAQAASFEHHEIDARIAHFTLVDEIIRGLLESLRPKLANPVIPNVNETIENPSVNASILISDIKLANADKFVIAKLHSTAIPLKISNLTLTLAELIASAEYDIRVVIAIPDLQEPIKIIAKGKASAVLKDLFFTIGANLDMKNGAIQIKPKGLFGFDVRLGKLNLTLSCAMGNDVIAKFLSEFLSRVIPGFIDDVKHPMFETFQDVIITFLNNLLKKKDKDEYLENRFFNFNKIKLGEGISYEDRAFRL